MRIIITNVSQLKRILGSSNNKFYLTSIMTRSQMDWRNTTLSPQGTTNPGTKAIPQIYFTKIKDYKGFEFHMKNYSANNFVLVPEGSVNGKAIRYVTTGSGGDYVKVGDLAPEIDEYLINIGPDFDLEEPSTITEVKDEKAQGIEFCTIL